METGTLNEWIAKDCGAPYTSGSSRIEASKAAAHEGQWSVRLEITTPSKPTSGARLFRWCEPRQHSRLFYSSWFFVPERYSIERYWNLVQWKSKTTTKNDPFFILNVGNRKDGLMYVYLYDWQNRRAYRQDAAILRPRTWVQLEAYYECMPDSSGKLSIWQDGRLLHDVRDVATRYREGDCQWSVNNYSDGLHPRTGTVFIDDAAIALSRVGSAPRTGR